MFHSIYRIHSFQIVAPYTLRIKFDDGVSQLINFRSWLKGELYGPLRELTVFNQVQLDPEVHTLVWPNGADFDPATLHDWPVLHHSNLNEGELHQSLLDYRGFARIATCKTRGTSGTNAEFGGGKENDGGQWA